MMRRRKWASTMVMGEPNDRGNRAWFFTYQINRKSRNFGEPAVRSVGPVEGVEQKQGPLFRS